MFLKLNLLLLLISHSKIHGLASEKVKTVGATKSFKSEIVIIDEDFDVTLKLRKRAIKEIDTKRNDNPIFEEESSGDGLIIEPLSEQLDGLKTSETSDYTNATMATEAQDNIQNSTDSDMRTDSNGEIEVSDDDVITSTIESTLVLNISTSGNGIITRYPSTTVDSSISDSDNSGTDLNESMLISCMESTCTPLDLTISSSVNGLVPESANLTFKCFSSNYSSVDLYWYKVNVSVSKLIKSHNQSVLELNIVEAKLFDAGIYTCVRHFEGTCCYKEIHLNVYEYPAYKYHLLTIGVVVAACLVTCLLVGIWRHWTMSKYEKKLRNRKIKQSLLS